MLSGGGARAAYEVGVLKAIYNGKCPVASGPPEVFSGTGAGAFNAAVIASRLPGQFPAPIAYLESLWADEIPQEGLMRNNRVFRKRLDTLQFFDIPFMWRHMNASNGRNRVVVHQYRPKTLLGGNTGLLNFARENIQSFIAAGEQDRASSECIV